MLGGGSTTNPGLSENFNHLNFGQSDARDTFNNGPSMTVYDNGRDPFRNNAPGFADI